MSPLMLLEVSLVVGLVRAVAAVVDLLTSMLVSVTEALSSQPHEPSTNCDSLVDMDFFHVSSLRHLVVEGFITL